MFWKISPDLSQKLSDLSRSEQNRHRSKWKMANHRRIWTEEAFIWSGGRAGRVAAVLEEKTRHSTRRNRVWRIETRGRPPESSGRAASGSVRAGFSVWSGERVAWTPLVLVYVCIENSKRVCLHFFVWVRVLFTGPVSTNFSKFFFKTGFYDTIHTFKNYFVTLFLVFNFQQ